MSIDNIDQSTSSTTANSSFHGTAISITQHPEEDNLGSPQKPTLMENSDSLQLKPLPDYYTVIPDILPSKVDIGESCISPTTSFMGISCDDILSEEKWLNYLFEKLGGNEQGENIHWAAYHASKSNGLQREKVINAVLPLFYEAAHSAAMILHSLNIVIMTTNFLNSFLNPLPDITIIYTKRRPNESPSTLIYNIEKLGKDQFEKFNYSFLLKVLNPFMRQ